MNCENCSIEHDGSFASGRFCSRKCSRGFSTKAKRQEINKKVSQKTKGVSKPGRPGSAEHLRPYWWSTDKPPFREKKPLDLVFSNVLPYRTLHLKLRLFEEGLKERKCEWCGITEWNGQPAPLELDHIDGNSQDNSFENLRVLCPNCHAQTPTYRGANAKLKRINRV